MTIKIHKESSYTRIHINKTMELEGEAVVEEEEDTEDEEGADEIHKTQQTIKLKVKKRRRRTDQRLFASDVIRMATLHQCVLRDFKRYKNQTRWRQRKPIQPSTCTRLYS